MKIFARGGKSSRRRRRGNAVRRKRKDVVHLGPCRRITRRVRVLRLGLSRSQTPARADALLRHARARAAVTQLRERYVPNRSTPSPIGGTSFRFPSSEGDTRASGRWLGRLALSEASGRRVSETGSAAGVGSRRRLGRVGGGLSRARLLRLLPYVCRCGALRVELDDRVDPRRVSGAIAGARLRGLRGTAPRRLLAAVLREALQTGSPCRAPGRAPSGAPGGAPRRAPGAAPGRAPGGAVRLVRSGSESQESEPQAQPQASEPQALPQARAPGLERAFQPQRSGLAMTAFTHDSALKSLAGLSHGVHELVQGRVRVDRGRDRDRRRALTSPVPAAIGSVPGSDRDSWSA